MSTTPHQPTPEQRAKKFISDNWTVLNPLLEKQLATIFEKQDTLERQLADARKERDEARSDYNSMKQRAVDLASERDDLKRKLDEQIQNNGKWLGYLCRICAVLNLPLETDGDALIGSITQLRAENAELLKDKERLDWLETQGMIGIHHEGYGDYTYYAGNGFPPIRTAIDAARQPAQ